MYYEVIDTDLPITQMTEIQTIQAIFDGKLGLWSSIRALGGNKWQPCAWTNPYAYFMPRIVPKKSQCGNLDGNLYLCSDADKIAAKTKEVIESDDLKKGGFFIPIFIGKNMDAMIPSKMFDFGSSVYAVPFLYPNEFKASSEEGTTLYLTAFNLNDKKSANCELKIQTSTLFQDVIFIEDESKLKFSLDPGKFMFTEIPIGIYEGAKPKEYSMTVLGKTKTKEKVASAAATLALSVGISILLGGGMAGYSYNDGKGFSLKFKIT